MDEQQRFVAERCLSAAHDDFLDFPAIVSRLIDAGFEGYSIDFRRQTASYYLPNGECLDLPVSGDETSISSSFESGAISDAIREAQSGSADYSYLGFCKQVKKAGCAGYVVSFSGRRALYFGRTAETHVEHFPD